MEFLLRLKAWNAFMVLFGGAFMVQIINIIMVTIHVTFSYYVSYILLIVSLATLFAFAAWQYSLAGAINSRISEESRKDISTFRFFLFVDVVISGAWGMITLLGFDEWINISPKTELLNSLISLAFSIYFSSFLSKLLVIYEVEKGKATSASSTGYFFHFLFYPIGIWWLQPKINEMIDGVAEPGVDPDAPLDHHSWNRNPDN